MDEKSPENLEKKIKKDQEFMKTLKIAVPGSSSYSKKEEEEFSKGEFTTEHQLRLYIQSEKNRTLVKDMKRRRKFAKKDEKRFGGPIHLWTDADRRKRIKEENLQRLVTRHQKNIAVDELREKLLKRKESEMAKLKKEKEAVAEKEVVKKTTKAVKTSKKTMTSKKTKKTRGPRVVDGKISLLETKNPKREGSKAHKRYELYRKHKTVASYLSAGGKRSSLRYDSKHGYIKLSNVKHKGDE